MRSALLFIYFVLVMLPAGSNAQCTATISAFPYNQDFESGAGGWTSGGTNDDWALGLPAKPVISSAGSGLNCWITGGLSASFYNFGERSYVQSPCFDFSSLSHPVISFAVCWETEYKYDGGNLQYSIDGGSVWTNVGTTNEPTDCYTASWYNYANILNLSSLASPSQGWSGNIQPTSGSCQGGNGSNGWLSAKHCLLNLAHQPQVIFRFTFGAGTTCNDYDGFAFDKVTIDEATPPVADFSYTCTASNTVSFNDLSTNCATSWSWNFGDNTSGSSQNPSHTYSAGTYSVVLTAQNACSGLDSITKTLTIISGTTASANETCPGNSDGSASVSISPAGGYSYVWNTSPAQFAATATNLTSGNYSVDITGASVCPLTLTVQVQANSNTIQAAVASVATSCAEVNDGQAIIAVSTPGSYSYSWNTSPVQTADTAVNLAAGMYSVTVSGGSLCSAVSYNVQVTQGTSGVPHFSLGHDSVICPGSMVRISAGNFSGYQWSDNSDSSYILVSRGGVYSVIVTSAVGCTGTDSVELEESCLDDVVLPNCFTPNGDGHNDLFFAYGIHVKDFSLMVFDRWGEKIFESDNFQKGWDGRFKNHLAPDGIYAWIATYSMDGKVEKQKTGHVTLVY